MKIVNLTEKDFGEVCQFLTETMPYDRFTEESLKEQTVGDPDYESNLALVAKKKKKIEGFILGICREENLGGIKVFSVKNCKDSEEIGTRLLERIEEKFTEKGISKIKVGHIPPKYFQPGIDARYTTIAAILLKRGYQIEETTQNMNVDLTAVKLDTEKKERNLREQGIIVKRLDEKDKKAYMHFLRSWSSNWFYSGMLAYDIEPISCHIAKKNNKVVGFACHSVVADHYFGPMGTSLRNQGKGIGQVLLKRCLKDIKRIGEKKATILAVGPVYFYWKSVGAKISRLFWEMSKNLKKYKETI